MAFTKTKKGYHRNEGHKVPTPEPVKTATIKGVSEREVHEFFGGYAIISVTKKASARWQLRISPDREAHRVHATLEQFSAEYPGNDVAVCFS